MIELKYEMTYDETIDGPLRSTGGSPFGERLCWAGDNRDASGSANHRDLVDARTGWIRLGADGFRRPDLRTQLITDDGELILFRYDLAMIRPSERFLAALAAGEATEFEDRYMRMSPQFEVAVGQYAWLRENLFLGRGRLMGPNAIA